MGSVFHRFERQDSFETVVHARPRASFVSGTMGWRGSLGVSGSLSLYGGVRQRADVGPGAVYTSGLEVVPIDLLDTHSIDKVVFVSGSYPATGSVSYVRVRTAFPATADLVTDQDWYGEHWGPIELLYPFHARLNPAIFFTGSYDYQCLRFLQSTGSLATAVSFNSCSLSTVTSSFSFEARCRPLSVTGSHDFALMSQFGRFTFYVSGSSGRLAFAANSTVVTSSAVLSRGRWTTAGVTGDGATWTLYLDGAPVGSAAVVSASLVSVSASLVVGCVSSSANTRDAGFDGFISETRAWSVARSAAQVSGSAFGALVRASGSLTLCHYARYTDGPLASSHGAGLGLGVRDWSPYAKNGQMVGFGATLPLTPTWHRNDDLGFVVPKKPAEGTPTSFRTVHLPSLFYGRQIATGSLRMECHAYDRQGIVRVLLDDGRGGVYLSGSCVVPAGGEQSAGVRWNKVGNVFYGEGLVVLTDPTMQDFGDVALDSAVTGTMSLAFRGETRVHTKVLMCRLGAGEGNASSNPTYSQLDDRGDEDPTNDRFVLRRPEPTTWITAVGLYDSQRRLMAVAKLAAPLRKREVDRLDIRLKLDAS